MVYVCKVIAHSYTELVHSLIKIIEILASSWDLLSVSDLLPRTRLYLRKYPADNTPFLGGFLADPATQYSAFQNVAFFRSYPYALPGFVSGAFCLSASIMGIISLEEVSYFQHVLTERNLKNHHQTLPSKLDANGQPKPDTGMSTWELMKAPGVAIVVFIYSHVVLQALCYTAGMLHSFALTNRAITKRDMKLRPSLKRPLSVSAEGDSPHSGYP